MLTNAEHAYDQGNFRLARQLAKQVAQEKDASPEDQALARELLGRLAPDRKMIVLLTFATLVFLGSSIYYMIP